MVIGNFGCAFQALQETAQGDASIGASIGVSRVLTAVALTRRRQVSPSSMPPTSWEICLAISSAAARIRRSSATLRRFQIHSGACKQPSLTQRGGLVGRVPQEGTPRAVTSPPGMVVGESNRAVAEVAALNRNRKSSRSGRALAWPRQRRALRVAQRLAKPSMPTA